MVIIPELSPRTVAEAFYNGETENELRRMDKVEYRFKKDSNREECMTMIETARRERQGRRKQLSIGQAKIL